MALISICCSVSLRQAYLNSASTQSNLFNLFHFKGLTVQVFRSVRSNPVECVTFLGASEMNCVSCISWATVSLTPWLPSSWGAWRSSVEIQDCCSQGVTVTFGRHLVLKVSGLILKVAWSKWVELLPEELAATPMAPFSWLLKPRKRENKQVYFLFCSIS